MAVIFTFANSIYKVTDHGLCCIPLNVVKSVVDLFPGQRRCDSRSSSFGRQLGVVRQVLN